MTDERQIELRNVLGRFLSENSGRLADATASIRKAIPPEHRDARSVRDWLLTYTDLTGEQIDQLSIDDVNAIVRRHLRDRDRPPIIVNYQALTAAPLPATDAGPFPPHDLVTLDQAAAMVHRNKRSLERYITKGELPAPYVEGGGGRAAYWQWDVIQPWLTKKFGIGLPDRFPASLR
jgi:hypothetical protein